jgi:peptidoglycan-associated lipoprotein
MIRNLAVIFLLALASISAAPGQQMTTDVDASPSHFDLAAGYNFIRANAPPGSCDCFSLNGGFVSGDFQLSPWFGLKGEFTGQHASKISSLGQDLTLTTFMGGPEVSWVHMRFTPYVDFLLGGAHAGNSYFPTSASGSSSASSFAYSPGGGLDVNLTSRISVRAVDAHYLHTAFPNGTNGVQHQLQIGAGIVVHFGSMRSPIAEPEPSPASRPAAEVRLSCSATNPIVTAGSTVHIIADSMTLPDSQPVNYNWSSTAGQVNGSGQTITVDTSGLGPGEYRVDGSATLVSDPSIDAACEVTFEVKPAPVADSAEAAADTVAPAPKLASDDLQKDFRSHVQDAFFNYNESDLRPDAQQAVSKDAAYLSAHPDLNITIAGYADERGSDEYNIALGLKRAVAARDALVASGIPIARIQVLSYGKEKSFCSDDTESCYQSNRRAQLLLSAK